MQVWANRPCKSDSMYIFVNHAQWELLEVRHSVLVVLSPSVFLCAAAFLNVTVLLAVMMPFYSWMFSGKILKRARFKSLYLISVCTFSWWSTFWHVFDRRADIACRKLDVRLKCWKDCFLRSAFQPNDYASERFLWPQSLSSRITSTFGQTFSYTSFQPCSAMTGWSLPPGSRQRLTVLVWVLLRSACFPVTGHDLVIVVLLI